MIAAALLAVAGRAASANGTYIFSVTSRTDAHDAHPGDGACADAWGACTLRAALEEANALPVGSSVTVKLTAGTYRLTLGNLVASKNTVRIVGAGSSSTVVDAQGRSQILVVDAGVRTRLEGVTVRGGSAPESTYGGAVLNAGRLTVDRSVVTGNTATAGGGLANAGGTLVIKSSSVTHNVAVNYGGGGIQNGGVANVPGAVIIESSVIEYNSSSDDGAGILNGANGHPSGPSVPASLPLVRGRPELPARPFPHRLSIATGTLSLTVVSSTIQRNRDGNAGGGIANDGGVTEIRGSTITDNHAPAGSGGGISTYGTLTVSATTIDSNRAPYGAGIEAFTGGLPSSVTVATSTFAGNAASQLGGAIDDASDVRVLRSTLFANSAAGGGGAIEIEGGTARITNSTVVSNKAPPGAGAITTYACGTATLSFDTVANSSNDLTISCPGVTLTGTIVSGATSVANCTGYAPSERAGFNLDSGASCALSRPTDRSNVNPKIGPPADNGGSTETDALLVGSPAIDAGGNHSTGCPATDERGVFRPQGPACDIGAFERAASG